MTYKEKVIDLLKRMMADTKKKRDYLERYKCSEDVKRLDGGLNFANNFLAALTSIKEDPVPERIGNEPEDFVVEGKTIIVNEPPVDDQPQFNLDVDESNVFTEPAESEDERIRKWLLEYFYLHRDDLRGASVSDMDILNWLERQKEQKSVEDKDLSKCSEDIQEFMEIFCEDQPKAYWDGVADTLEWIKEHPNNQFMQKPAERAEINKSLSDAVIAELDKYSGENHWKSPWVIDSTGLHYPLYFANLGATWQKEQKPAWSEVDLIHLTNAILSAEKEWGIKSCTAKWLKSLPERFNPQPKPSWKPSEEQMEVLRKYVMGEWKGLTFKEDEHLKSLLIDLENYSHDNR